MAVFTGAEILELQDGETKSIHVQTWELGEMDIQPKAGPPTKRIRVLRVWVPPSEKAVGPNYWDITGQTLIAQLVPYLERADYRDLAFTITKHGIPPKARFQLQVAVP